MIKEDQEILHDEPEFVAARQIAWYHIEKDIRESHCNKCGSYTLPYADEIVTIAKFPSYRVRCSCRCRFLRRNFVFSEEEVKAAEKIFSKKKSSILLSSILL